MFPNTEYIKTLVNGCKVALDDKFVAIDEKIDNYIDDIHNIELDPTLTIEGQAADAKVVGDALANHEHSWNDLTDKPVIPSIDGLATESYVDTSVANLVNSAPEALNTLDELAAALGDDSNFATTVTNQISKKIGYEPQTLTDDQKVQARENIGAGRPIIDVVALPETDIDENAMYRLLTGTFVNNQKYLYVNKCYCVNELPEVGEAVTDVNMTAITAYYNVQDNICYGYVDNILSAALGAPVGWYDFGILMSSANMTWGGVITDIMDDPCDGIMRLLLRYVLYSYKDGWTSLKFIGDIGTGSSSEIFNHPSNKASGTCSHAEGHLTYAEGYSAHAEGYNSHAEGDYSHAEGYNSHAEGSYSHAEGQMSHAEGQMSHAEGSYSHAEGQMSHAEGNHSNAEGRQSHAEGYRTYAGGSSSHAEGAGSNSQNKNITGAANSTTYTVDSVTDLNIGDRIIRISNDIKYKAIITSIDATNSTITLNKTLSTDVALNNIVVAVYSGASAFGDYSHVEGYQTIAAGRGQHTQGEFNIIDPDFDINNGYVRGKYAHIVGNGSSNTDRSNAHTLDWDGNAWFQGDVYVGGTGQDDATAEKLVKASELVQADWSQNDETAVDYVKNRTHYIETPEIVIFPETEMTFTTDMGVPMATVNELFPLVVGETYKVIWDGVEYECVCANSSFNGMSSIGLGNAAIYGGGENTGEPFAVGVIAAANMSGFITTSGTTHTVEVVALEQVKKLDNKFLDLDWLPINRTVHEPVGEPVEVVAERTVYDANGHSLAENTSGVLEVGDFASVVFDGETYLLSAKTRRYDAEGKYCKLTLFGNTAISTEYDDFAYGVPSAEDTGEPFLLVTHVESNLFSNEVEYHDGVILYTKDGGECVISVSHIDGADVLLANRMPKEFLPESVDSFILNSSTEGSTKKFRITVDDSGTLTATEVTT